MSELSHLDELEALSGNEISAMKSYITRQRISVRKAYGRYKSNFVRRASFLGSVNDDKFLTDITGNRRWLVFTVKDIDYEHHVDIGGLWSQVYYLWNNNFRYWFNAEEIENVNKRNEKFRITNEEEECLVDMFEFKFHDPLPLNTIFALVDFERERVLLPEPVNNNCPSYESINEELVLMYEPVISIDVLLFPFSSFW